MSNRCSDCDLPNGCPEFCRCIDTADHVYHAPSGEGLLVAYVAGDKLVCCGWPESIVRLSDCTLTMKATAKARDELLRCMAAMVDHDCFGTESSDDG